jgi:hypothetical protein
MNAPAWLERLVPGSRRVAGMLERWLGFIFFWALWSWWREAPGLIGPNGILPAGDYLEAVGAHFGPVGRVLFAPSLLWLGHGTLALHAICGLGLAASLAAMLRWHPRWALGVCAACFLSLAAAAQVFASYQSDGMLMAAGLVALFLNDRAPSWWNLFSFRWLWFSIYFGSGTAKLLSGDPTWRHLTALDQYYQNLPLPNLFGWYVQNYLPHAAEAAIAGSILVIELAVCWLCFFPRRWRIACFWITTPFQLAIIATANYGFLNWLVLGLGLALIDDQHLAWIATWVGLRRRPAAETAPAQGGWRTAAGSLALAAWVLLTGANLAQRLWPPFPAPAAVTDLLAPFRIVDPFGLFATMTPHRYEIEFQGSNDGTHWRAYGFKYKPQNPRRAPTGDLFLFAPYQPRFDWNLWFASLAPWQENTWIEQVELRLLENTPAVMRLFASNPFASKPPRAVRAVLWQYWFTTPQEKRATGAWWRRQNLGLFAPEIALTPAGAAVVRMPGG